MPETRDHAKYPLLLGECEVCLEADEVVRRADGVLGTQLDDGPGPRPGPRIGEADRLQRAETQRVAARACDFLGGLTGLEEVGALEFLGSDTSRREERIVVGVVLLGRRGCVQVVRGSGLVVARLGEDDRPIECLGIYDWRGGVEEREPVADK